MPAPSPEWQEFMDGAEPADRGGPAAIAWALEHAAAREGWPEGAYVGSERALRVRFAASRALIRQAIRIVESHGSMRMKRGRQGGLYLTRAPVESAASALATYLCAIGCTAEDLRQTARVAQPLLAELPEGAMLRILCEHTQYLFATGDIAATEDSPRGTLIALRLLTDLPTIPEPGRALGFEAELCERFHCSRATFRQALRVLDDLGMLQVRRGRGGGYLLKRPSRIGMIRRLFTLFASWQLSLHEIVQMTWVLNLVNLRLCVQNLQLLAANEQMLRCDRMEAVLVGTPEPQRWTRLQQQLERTAASRLANTLLNCAVAYYARLGRPFAPWSAIEQPMLRLEQQLVRSLRGGDGQEAERATRRAQTLVSRLLGVPDLPWPNALLGAP